MLRYRRSHNKNFCRGVAELVAAIQGKRSSRLHICEVVLAIDNPRETKEDYTILTNCFLWRPMSYAQ